MSKLFSSIFVLSIIGGIIYGFSFSLIDNEAKYMLLTIYTIITFFITLFQDWKEVDGENYKLRTCFRNIFFWPVIAIWFLMKEAYEGFIEIKEVW